MLTLQKIIQNLNTYWENQGAVLTFPHDIEKGAGTFNPNTFLKSLDNKPWKVAYVEPCRRPKDGRYGENPYRTQHYYQYQVLLKPVPENIQNLYIESLEKIGISKKEHDIRFVMDDWKSPTIGAWGLGWEIWVDGMEVTQFTYFQKVGGLEVNPICVELTYGLERLAMYIQKVDSMFDIKWNDKITYGEMFKRREYEYSVYNFEMVNIDNLLNEFEKNESEIEGLIEKNLVAPAYDLVMKNSHIFNLLDARGAISVSERTAYIRRIRSLAISCAKKYREILAQKKGASDEK